jgi:hypothetical protein
MTILEIGIGALVSAGIGAGMHSAYVGSLIDECHERAASFAFMPGDRQVASAFEFAKCMSARRYDPMYDYNRFKGK